MADLICCEINFIRQIKSSPFTATRECNNILRGTGTSHSEMQSPIAMAVKTGRGLGRVAAAAGRRDGGRGMRDEGHGKGVLRLIPREEVALVKKSFSPIPH